MYAPLIALLVQLAVPQPATSLVKQVRAAISGGQLPQAAAAVREYRATRGVTPELLVGMTWVARGEFARKNYGQAETLALEVNGLSTDMLKRRPLDADPDLPLALGASIEVQAQVLAARGGRTEAVAYLGGQLAIYRRTSIGMRIQKNINLLSLEGKRAPALEGIRLPAGKPVLLFFWAHWCSDCRAEIRILERLKAEFAAAGLTVIGATQKYGYVAGGEDATTAMELQYIEAIRRKFYSGLVNAPAVVNEANFRIYGVSTTPTLVLVDRRGVVRLYHPGGMTYDELRRRITVLR